MEVSGFCVDAALTMDDEVLLRVECRRVAPLLLTGGGVWLVVVCFGGLGVCLACLASFLCCCFVATICLPQITVCRSHKSCAPPLSCSIVEWDTRFPMSNLIHSRFFVVWTASIPRDPSQPAKKKNNLRGSAHGAGMLVHPGSRIMLSFDKSDQRLGCRWVTGALNLDPSMLTRGSRRCLLRRLHDSV